MFSLYELLSIFQWSAALFIIGIIFFPLTNTIFINFADRGYLFSKVLGAGLISYFILVSGVLHVLPFGIISILLAIWIGIILNFVFFRKKISFKKLPFKLILFEEFIFILGIFVWSFVRAHEPAINGLEKFMDFGFLNSILRTTWQPATDMWFSPLPINYYYFGHLVAAVLTELSRLPANITYNLMIATLFSFCFTLVFSLALTLISKGTVKRIGIIGGLLSGILVTLSGNLHTVYAFFKPYNVDHPIPFWNLLFSPNTFPNGYWYPNATRFIPFTIHEFPLYSFVVSDLHGHVLDIPFVLLTIAVLFSIFLNPKPRLNYLLLTLLGLLLAILYMTNIWDAAIYMLLAFSVLFIKNRRESFKKTLIETAKPAFIIFILFIIFSLPFSLFFKPFAAGIGILCAPSFLTNIGRIGPFLFETAHCQKSMWWQLLTLYGFFYFFVLSFLVFILKIRNKFKIEPTDIFVLILIALSTLLIIVPEFVYVKDIYPAHYRANTMFKLVYEAYIMLAISSGYIIVRIIPNIKQKIFRIFNFYFVFFIFTILFLILVMVYPYYAITSYYGDLKTYSGIDGTAYLKTKLPHDYSAINWINRNITGRPVIVEAQGDSYTDYARISSNTGLPTILGWTVHEWLWRGSYNIPAPRIQEVKDIYENKDVALTRKLLRKHNAEYVYIGGLEREKYPDLIESKFELLGKIIWQEGETKIYKIAY